MSRQKQTEGQLSFGSYKLPEARIELKEGQSLYSEQPMDNPEAATDAIGHLLSRADREVCCVVNLDTHLRPINYHVVSIGGINSAQVPPENVFKTAIVENASAVMMFHNHPSGDTTPSQEDIDLTNRLIQAGNILDIPVVDHIIIGGGNDKHYSLREGHAVSFEDGSDRAAERSARYKVSGKSSAARREEMKALTDKLEAGVDAVRSSEGWKQMMDTMSRFHSYSLNNQLLISMQRPDASTVASYTTWKSLGRQVNRGEKGIKILCPTPYKTTVKTEKTGSDGQVMTGADGKPVTEETEVTRTGFKVGYTFDISQTSGKELPRIGVDELTGSVDGYQQLLEAIEKSSPVPIEYGDIPSGAKGYYDNASDSIKVKSGMSEVQTIKTLLHEETHATLHSNDRIPESKSLSRDMKEVQAESVAYVVSRHYGIDTSEYSFPYVATWGDMSNNDLRQSLKTICSTANDMIDKIDEHLALTSKTVRSDEKASEERLIQKAECTESLHR